MTIDVMLNKADTPINDWQSLVLEMDHIAVAVTDLSAAIRWYVTGLGFTLKERRETNGRHTGMQSAVLTAGDAVVVLIQGTDANSQVSRFVSKCGSGVQHVAFLVTDLDEAIRRVIRSGGGIDTDMIVDKGIRQVFLRRDPDSGVRVELIERRGGTFTDMSVQKLFLEFESRGLY